MDGHETITEMADRLKVTRETIRQWRRRHSDFPDPTGTRTGGANEFSVMAVEQWRLIHDLPNRGMQESQQIRRLAG